MIQAVASGLAPLSSLTVTIFLCYEAVEHLSR